MADDEAKINDMIRRYIEPNPPRPGVDEARLVESGVAVWAVIGYLQAAAGDLRRVAEDDDIPLEAVRAALAFYERHRAAIDARIEANAAVVA